MKISSSERDPGPRVDWGDALVVPNFYGREEELAQLAQWVVQEDCRVVSVLGMGGIGKSALVVSSIHRLVVGTGQAAVWTSQRPQGAVPTAACPFEVVIFRSLRDAPSCEALLDDCLQVLSPQPLSTLPATLEQRISLLLEYLRKARVLMVLDNLECLLQEGNVRGHFRPGYEGYELLLHRVVETVHQSCLLFTSREMPAELRLLEGRYPSVRSLRLAGLDVASCQQFFVEKEVVGTKPEQESLIEVYAGNPLALKIIAETIVDLFGGEIGQFLASESSVIFGSITNLLDEQFARLSVLEQTVLCWLAIIREPGILDELLALLVTPLPRRQVLLEAIDGLRRRSLIEGGKRAGSFTLQSVVLEYVTAVLVAEGSREIQQRQLDRLIQYGLSQAHTKEYVRKSQERLLVVPLLAALQSSYLERSGGLQEAGASSALTNETVPEEDERSIIVGAGLAPAFEPVEKQLLSLFDQLSELDDDAQGYGPANLIALLRLLRGDLKGIDLSQLSIRGAYLQSVEMQGASMAGALIRDSVFTQAVSATWTVAISLDGKWWAAGSMQGKVRVWDEGSQTLLLIWQAHTGMVTALAFSPDGCTLVSGGGDGTVKLWDMGSRGASPRGALLWTGWQNSPESLTFSPDGSLIASGGHDATVRLWDAQSGMNLQTLRHPSPVWTVVWSPDGHLLASGTSDGEIRLWERQKTVPATCDEVLSMQATNWVTSLAFAPDGRTLASGHRGRMIQLWEVPSGTPLRALSGQTDPVKCIVWSPDGRTLAYSCNEKAVWLWDVEQGRCRVALHGTADINGMAFAPDSSRLLTGSADSTLRVWDVENCQCVRAIAGYAASLYDLSWSPDGTHLVSSGTDGLVTIWDLSERTLPTELHGHTRAVYGVGWSPDGKFLASCGLDEVMHLWDPISGACVHRFEDSSAVFLGLAWNPGGSLLAGGTLLQGILVWDVRERSLRWIGMPYQASFHHVEWNPDGTRLACGSDNGNVYLWDGADGTLLERLPGHHSWVRSVGWSPDGRRLASGGGSGSSGELFVWDVETAERVQTFAERLGIVYALAWTPSGDLLVSGDTDGKLCWWDVQNGECVSIRAAHEGTIRSLRVSPDRRQLASCGDDGVIMIWDITSHEHLQTLRRDRPYERLNIRGIRGLNEAEIASLQALGAIEEPVP